MVTMYQDILTELSKETGMEQWLLFECPMETAAGMAALEMREAKIQLFVTLLSHHLKQGSMSCVVLHYGIIIVIL